VSAAVSDPSEMPPHSTRPARSCMPSNKSSEDATLRHAEKKNQKTECVSLNRTHNRLREREGGAGGEGGRGVGGGEYHARTHNRVVMLCRRLSRTCCPWFFVVL
jgi:hypothetical protein